MCGICGFLTKHEIGEGALRHMNDSLVHRGPDDRGEYLGDLKGFRIGLGHRRLSVLDLSMAGHQPMFSSDEQVGIVFNGEIYNFKEIRQKLQEKGCVFHSDCDTEVILAAYQSGGIEAVRSFNGMFAFALVDFQAGKMFFVRDRMGQKPLYLYERDGDIVFASELKAICRYPRFRKELREDLLARFMCHGYLAGSDSIFRSVRRILPGHIVCLRIDGASWQMEDCSYWDIPAIYEELHEACSLDYDAAKEELRNLLRRAVGYRMIADVPLGTFLSGGIDSSLVTAIAQEQSCRPVKTYSIGFANKKENEAVFAKQVADYLGTEHHELYVDEANYRAMLDDMFWYFDEPLADTSIFPTMLVSKFARGDVTVALSGDGGDELFCGYTSYDKLTVLEKMRALSKYTRFIGKHIRIRSNRSQKINFLFEQPLSAAQLLFPSEARQLDDVFLVPQRSIVFDEKNLRKYPLPVRRMLLDQLTYLPDDILMKVDRASMRFSLECRSPLLDPDIVKFALAIPQRFKYQGKTRKKAVMQDLLADYIPKSLFDRPKHGFGMRVGAYLLQSKELPGMLEEKRLQTQGIFRPRRVQETFREFSQTGNSDAETFVWRFYVFQGWYMRFMDEHFLD